MKKTIKSLFSATAASAAIICSAVFVSAEDYSLEFEAQTSNGSWGQSVTYWTTRNPDISDGFDPCTMTEDSVVQISYDCELADGENHIELIWQTWGEHVTPVADDWNKVAPSSFSDGYAEFTYSDITASYGTDDFSEVYAICVGDTGDAPITVTSIVITNVGTSEETAIEETTVTETEAVTEEETESETEAVTEEETETVTKEEADTETEAAAEAETTAAETEAITEKTTAETEAVTAAEAENTSSSGIDSGAIVIIVIIVIVIAAIIIMILMMRGKGPKTKNDDWKR